MADHELESMSGSDCDEFEATYDVDAAAAGAMNEGFGTAGAMVDVTVMLILLLSLKYLRRCKRSFAIPTLPNPMTLPMMVARLLEAAPTRCHRHLL